jgi:hypothetical protein
MVKMDGEFVGERKRGHDIGVKSSDEYLWMPCRKCGKNRWVRLNY